VWSDPEQGLSFFKRLANEPQFAMFKVAKAAMDQLGAGRRSMLAKVVALDKGDPQASARRITRNAYAIDATAYDQDIEAV
jgi:hypothetical protein